MVPKEQLQTKGSSVSANRLRRAVRHFSQFASPGVEIRKSIALANTNFSTPTLLEDAKKSGLKGASQIIHVMSDSDTCSPVVSTPGSTGPRHQVKPVSDKKGHLKEKATKVERRQKKARKGRSLATKEPKQGARKKKATARHRLVKRARSSALSAPVRTPQLLHPSLERKTEEANSIGPDSDSASPSVRALFDSPVSSTGGEANHIRGAIRRRRRALESRLEEYARRDLMLSDAALKKVISDQRLAASHRLYQRLRQLSNQDVKPSSTVGEMNSAPSRLTLYCSENGLRIAQSKLEVVLGEASSLGSYMPVVFGNHAVVCLYDSGASLTQFDSETVRKMGSNVTQVDAGLVDFISVESKRKLNMKLYFCSATALLHVDSGKTCLLYTSPSPRD